MIEKQKLAELIQETTNEVLNKNAEILGNTDAMEKTIELAIQLSCLTNLKLLQKLGIINNITN